MFAIKEIHLLKIEVMKEFFTFQWLVTWLFLSTVSYKYDAPQTIHSPRWVTP